ncbi:MAG: hypothetical protein P8X68_06420 [Desulfobacterales bacterium]|jgi:hypothetical protein
MNTNTRKLIKEKIIANEGQITKENSDYLEAIFSENKTEKAVKTFFIISEKLNQKAVLSGGNRLKIFI